MVRKAGAAIIAMACMAWSSGAWADCTSGIVPERLSCLNLELETQKAQAAKEIAALKADIQALRNQLLGLKQIVDGLPPAASIARLDDDMNVLWEPQDGCLAWTGPASGAPAPDGGGSLQVFAPCSKAPNPDSVAWRLRRVPATRAK
ncbi:MAG TPA: hypothetical protein VGN55_20420 [Xanthobacteraceae bacterium]|jgi:hypothetical protein